MIRIPRYHFPEIEIAHSKVITSNVDVKVESISIPSKQISHNPEKKKQLDSLLNRMQEVDIEYKDLDNTVFYDGNIDSPIMVIGEGPGENEVLQKKPFVGRSGKLLQEMLNTAGILRKNIYVTNVVVWRPPNNRTPLPDEIEAMRPYLMEHISIINPAIVILVGGIAYRGVMDKPIAISKIRGNWQTTNFCQNVINIFHPSYLLRSPIHRRESWRDILAIRQRIIELGYGNLLENGYLNLER